MAEQKCALPACRSTTPCRVCPFGFDCPTCQAGPGRRCKRPSGHACTVHEPRVLKADRHALLLHLDDVREDLGDGQTREWCERVGLAA